MRIQKSMIFRIVFRKEWIAASWILFSGCTGGSDENRDLVILATLTTVVSDYENSPAGLVASLAYGGGQPGQPPNRFEVSSGGKTYILTLDSRSSIHIEKLDFHLRSPFPGLSSSGRSMKTAPGSQIDRFNHTTNDTLAPVAETSPYRDPISFLSDVRTGDPSVEAIRIDGVPYGKTAEETRDDLPSGNIAAVVLHLYDLTLFGSIQDPDGNTKNFEIHTGRTDTGLTPACTTTTSPYTRTEFPVVLKFRNLFAEVGSATIISSMAGLSENPVLVNAYQNTTIHARILSNLAGSDVLKESSCSGNLR